MCLHLSFLEISVLEHKAWMGHSYLIVALFPLILYCNMVYTLQYLKLIGDPVGGGREAETKEEFPLEL